MNSLRKRIASGLTALIVTVSALSACSGDTQSSGTQQTEAQTQSADTSADNGAAQTADNAASLSNPVKLTADGDIDMEAALSYETDFDALLAQLDAKEKDDSVTVSDNTNPETLALYQYLRENYGKNVFAAQSVGGKDDTESILYYYLTGDLPAIKGFDFIFKTTPDGDGADWTQMAIDWHTQSNGIVYFCWHWNVPCDVDDPDSHAYAFYSEKITNFSLKNAVTPGTKEYEIAVHDIDLIAYELQRLEAAGVPVLWRPLHEASGSWFWWGVAKKEDVEYYQKLWYMIYDRLENYHKLTNLIWVWNGQSKNLVVNEHTYDISGIDVYPNSEDHSAQEKKYGELEKYTAEGKMLALSECGYIPDPDELAANADAVKWLFYMPWNGEFIFKGSSVMGVPYINEEKMTAEFLKKVMAADNIITWSELPDFDGTSRELPYRVTLALPDIEKQREKDAANG